MSGAQRSRPQIDESLLLQVAALPPGGQRWLKAALQTIATVEPFTEREEERAPPAPPPKPARRRPNLDDVLSGDADLREQAEKYPELAEELEGIADIADLLREAGREHRRLGEDVLREQESEEEKEGGEAEEEAEG